MKVRDLIHASARVIGIVASGENMTHAEVSDAGSALNMLLGQWSASRDYIYLTQDINVQLIAGQTEYAVKAELISEEASHNDRAIRIYRDTAQNTPPNSILYKKMPDGYALKTPPTETGMLYLQSLHSPEFPLKTTDDIYVPAVCFRALKYALAIELAPEYQLPVTPDVQTQYQQAMRIMHRAQSTPVPAQPDQTLMGISYWR